MWAVKYAILQHHHRTTNKRATDANFMAVDGPWTKCKPQN